MPYSRFYAEEMILRDHLALDRTTLANERTVLAYFRTAIMLFVTGLTIIKVFSDDRLLVVVGFGLLPIALAIFILGLLRFLKIRRKLRTLYKPLRK